MLFKKLEKFSNGTFLSKFICVLGASATKLIVCYIKTMGGQDGKNRYKTLFGLVF